MRRTAWVRWSTMSKRTIWDGRYRVGRWDKHVMALMYLVRRVFMDSVAHLADHLHLKFTLHLPHCQFLVQSVHTCKMIRGL